MDAAIVNRIIKAYDIRGLVDEEITPEFTFALGVAFARFLEGQREPATVVIGEDMRPSSSELAGAFSDGITSQSFDVLRIGLASTDQLYFASGDLGLPGAMFTASHNPAQYNGIKLCLSGARPIGQESGLAWIKQEILNGAPLGLRQLGSERSVAMLEPYVEFLFSLFADGAFDRDFQGRKLRIAIDAGNGMGGHTAPAVMSRINSELFALYFELDGTFPNHEANPIDPKNLRDLQKLVIENRADIGLAFDGDADRCFLVDETGAAISPSALTALISQRELRANPGAKIIHNLICSKTVPEVILESGGIPIRSRVGHSYIKKLMADSGAIFGGEHSGHFYFRDFWFADSGMLAALHAIAALLDEDRPLSEVIRPFERYAMSGELNTAVSDPKSAIAKIRSEYEALGEPLKLDELDGLTVTGEDWWFNVRPSNTEPLLRLNVEAKSHQAMIELRDRVLGQINNQ